MPKTPITPTPPDIAFPTDNYTEYEVGIMLNDLDGSHIIVAFIPGTHPDKVREMFMGAMRNAVDELLSRDIEEATKSLSKMVQAHQLGEELLKQQPDPSRN
jgi:hypothetical protein